MSSFGWLDADAGARRRMLEVIDLFREPGTVDELGIGAVRDAVSDILFPGTSVLHTRLRYVLFLPWLLQRAADQGGSADEIRARFRALEYQLIPSLARGGEIRGVMGNRAGGDLKRLPSVAYWSALSTWQIVRADSPDTYARLASDSRAVQRRAPKSDDPEARGWMPQPVADPSLPEAPADLLKSTSFALTAEDAGYLSDRISEATPGTALAWLCQHPPTELPDAIWGLDTSLPATIRRHVEHARQFSLAIHGASILYNLLLAKKTDNAGLADRYQGQLDSWEIEARAGLADWDRADFWTMIQKHNPRVSPGVRRFVDQWVGLLEEGPADCPATRTIVAEREIRIKGARARLTNQAALDAWRGDSGIGRLTFRWGVVRSHLHDLAEGRMST